MTPEQLKKETFKKILKIGHEQLETEEGESNKEEEELTTSSEMSEQNSESDTTTDDDIEGPTSTEDEEDSETTQMLQVHNVLNNTTHDENDYQKMKMIHLMKILGLKLKHLQIIGSKTMYKKTNS